MIAYVAHLDDPVIDAPARAFEALAQDADLGPHKLTFAPGSADLILFTQAHMLGSDWRLRQIAEHRLTIDFPDRVFVYDERDRPWCAFPGVYVSMPRCWFDATRQRAWSYYRVRDVGVAGDPDLLFSLIASPTARCRESLFALRHSDAYVEKVERFVFYDPQSLDFQQRRDRFDTVLGRSRFVLCPRGRGTSSIRLYETLAAGRVPVIIADNWVAPTGPDWDVFSIRWPEGRTVGLTELLEARAADWPEMAKQARAAHDAFFSERVSVKRILDLCDVLRRSRVGSVTRNSRFDLGYMAAGLDATRVSVERTARRQLRHLLGVATRVHDR